MIDTSEQTARANFLWGRATAQGLADLGVEQVFFSPGSRSTPLVVSCEREARLSCLPVLDERTAAFLALGHARRTQVPVALVCTSGSAPANWYPAVTEASYSGIPLLLLSADRPPELQECGAGQTINQINLFGSFVRFFHSLPVPRSEQDDIKNLQAILAKAYSEATGQSPGPVHLNFPFCEPLWPTLEVTSKFAHLVKTEASPRTADHPKNFAGNVSAAIRNSVRPIIIAGMNCPLNALQSFTTLPILCDSLSPLRENEHPARILRYENLLRCPEFSGSSTPDLFLVLGPLPSSKTLRAWMDQSGAKRVVIEPSGQKVDPLSSRGEQHTMRFEDLADIEFPTAEKDWLDKWITGDATVEKNITKEFLDLSFFEEPKVTRLLSENLPKNCHLHVANSMPIRDLEWFWKPGNRERKLHGARGVNGIDGTLGTAMGIAHLSKEPVYLLSGELAFLHDSNALLCASDIQGSLTVFVINNQGGGIFENLAVSSLSEFEKCFATPQNCDFFKLCQAHGVEYHLCKSEEELVSWMAHPHKLGIRVIEIQTDRKQDRDIRARLLSIGPSS
ncbi:2-succinyl-5-enolpyruvyl-6-hydroxy-3-cyclohexene-1-carboxylic-acid synthase [Opitutales bacterium]|nr:2-succinyl-5-enolpyruvyl-6-hydroxy-3-cyclohexene-1-carboxylic-acid synthase [Opitutales bacterium]